MGQECDGEKVGVHGKSLIVNLFTLQSPSQSMLPWPWTMAQALYER